MALAFLMHNLHMPSQWLKNKKFGVGTPIRERLATPIRGVGTLMCQKLDVWERCYRPFPLILNTGPSIKACKLHFVLLQNNSLNAVCADRGVR